MQTQLSTACQNVLTDLLCTYTNAQIRTQFANSSICPICGELGELGDTLCGGCEAESNISVADALDLYFML